MLLLLVGLCAFKLDLVQSDLQLIIDSMDLKFDPEYFSDCTADPCETTEMIAEFNWNCKILKKLPSEGTMKATLLKMIDDGSAEPTGIDMTMTLYQLVNETVVVGPFLDAMNVERKWPIDPVEMHLECYNPPMDQLPEFFPAGTYSFDLNITTGIKLLIGINMLLTVY